MEHQDWKTIVIKKRVSNNENQKVNKSKTYKNTKNSNIKNNIDSRKLDNSEDLKHIYVPKEVSIEIQKLRQAKGLTIKDLATKLNMSKQDLNNIEQGKALYNKALINKIKKILLK